MYVSCIAERGGAELAQGSNLVEPCGELQANQISDYNWKSIWESRHFGIVHNSPLPDELSVVLEAAPGSDMQR